MEPRLYSLQNEYPVITPALTHMSTDKQHVQGLHDIENKISPKDRGKQLTFLNELIV